MADRDQSAQDHVEVVALLALEHDRVAGSDVRAAHVLGELRQHLAGQLLEEPDAGELGHGCGRETRHGPILADDGRARSVEALSALRSGRRTGGRPGRMLRVRVQGVRELEAHRERRLPRRRGARDAVAAGDRAGEGQVGLPGRVPRGGGASARLPQAGAAGGGRRRDRAARLPRRLAGQVRRRRLRRDDAQPVLDGAHRLGHSRARRRRGRAPLVRAGGGVRGRPRVPAHARGASSALRQEHA